jgi:fructoselysine 6-kinase
VSVSYDFSAGHIPPQLDGLAIAFIPGELLPAGADPAASACELVDRGCSCAVVTLGSKGSVAATADEEEGVSAAPLASVLDTCGAGDAFIAAFIVGRLAGRTLRECLAVGAEAGAEACSIVGAFPQRGAQTLVEQ